MPIHPSLQPSDKDTDAIYPYPKLVLASIADIALQLHEELNGSGYSLLLADVEKVILAETQIYAAWALLECQKQQQSSLLDHDTTLHAYEWAIIEPVARAHCDLLQARLVEGSRSLGGDGFGLQVSEAQQNYLQAKEMLAKSAFVAPPYSLDTD